MEIEVKTRWLDRDLIIKTGKLAKQANSAVTVQYGETVVMATVVQNESAREGVNFFPLMVEFQEKLYAAGIIKGSRWIKREGRPSDDAVLTGRMIDRSIRPLFEQKDRRDVQVIITVLSVDQENDYDIVSLIASSAALAISGIEWRGPIAGLRVAYVNNEFVFNPSYALKAESSLDLIIAGSSEKIIMIEAGAKEISEELMFEAILAGQKNLDPALSLIKELQAKLEPKPVREKKVFKSDSEIELEERKEKAISLAEDFLKKNVYNSLFSKTLKSKEERKAARQDLSEALEEELFKQGYSSDERKYAIAKLLDDFIEAEVSRVILEESRRIDGRALTELRDLSSEVALIPRDHGSSLFSRGETQVMSIVTLGAPGLEQSLEGMEGQSKKRYMHHYNFPPYSVGEASPIRGTGRREIGHGALAEKALIPVVPNREDFPYTVRVVSETLGSNGSSSMASTCASSLALMDAGVPIKSAVAGIAMGLASNSDMSKWAVLTDIQDLEDGEGGMDFKMTGTKDGLTAIQLDTKTEGLSHEIIKQSLSQGREALNQILANIESVMTKPRPELSPYAPRIISLQVDPEKIGMIIGPGGKTINKIIDETEVSIDIEDDGMVLICGTDSEKAQVALNKVKEIVHVFEEGEIINGKVVRMMDFGAFVQLNNNQDGLIRNSELAPYYVNAPQDILNIGDEVRVKIIEVDQQGRINLSLKALEDNAKYWENERGKSTPKERGSMRPNQQGRQRKGPYQAQNRRRSSF